MDIQSNRSRCMVLFFFVILFFTMMMSRPGVAEVGVVVGDFVAGELEDWKEEVFSGKTLYELVDSADGSTLKADSKASASGLFREITIDLKKTPCLVWSWKVDGILEGLDETTKGGDDYPARIYVIFSGGLFFWNTRALNYVWSSNQPMDSVWPNAFTDRSVMIAVNSRKTKVGQWVQHSRNIREDYNRLIGEDVTTVDAVAIMTDTDNSEREVTAYYGNVRFTPSC